MTAKHPRQRLPPEKLEAIRHLVKTKMPLRRIARALGVHLDTVRLTRDRATAEQAEESAQSGEQDLLDQLLALAQERSARLVVKLTPQERREVHQALVALQLIQLSVEPLQVGPA